MCSLLIWYYKSRIITLFIVYTILSFCFLPMSCFDMGSLLYGPYFIVRIIHELGDIQELHNVNLGQILNPSIPCHAILAFVYCLLMFNFNQWSPPSLLVLCGFLAFPKANSTYDLHSILYCIVCFITIFICDSYSAQIYTCWCPYVCPSQLFEHVPIVGSLLVSVLGCPAIY